MNYINKHQNESQVLKAKSSKWNVRQRIDDLLHHNKFHKVHGQNEAFHYLYVHKVVHPPQVQLNQYLTAGLNYIPFQAPQPSC